MTSAIALLDLDGTVADYDGAVKREMDKLRAPDEPPYVSLRDNEPEWQAARRRLVTRKPGFWKNLQKLELGMAIYRKLDQLGFEIHVLTKGPRSKSKARVWMEKYEWCCDNLPKAKVTITQEKSLVYGRVLVDDWGKYFLPWAERRPRGVVIVPAQPWNENCFDGLPGSVCARIHRISSLQDIPDYVTSVLMAARDRPSLS